MRNEEITKDKYQNEIKDLAEITIESFKEYNYSDISEAVFETLDSHQWIIYTGYTLDIIQKSPTSLDQVEWQIFVDLDDADYRDIFQAMAWALMEHDLYEAIRDVDNSML